jgi:hypothetical protein
MRKEKPTKAMIALKPGAIVEVVLRDDGTCTRCTVESKPWQVASGQYYIQLKGISGGCLLSRVKNIFKN